MKTDNLHESISDREREIEIERERQEDDGETGSV